MGSEKKRAKDIIEAESLSAGRPVEAIRAEMVRAGDEGAGEGKASDVFAACAFAVGVVLAAACCDGSGVVLFMGVMNYPAAILRTLVQVQYSNPEEL
jgi:hypothetical protein